MNSVIFSRMFERAENAKNDSDTSYLMALLYFGEMITKFTTLILVSLMNEDKDRNKYRHYHRLVRADGIGEWSTVIDDILIGPSSALLIEEARENLRELKDKQPENSWQTKACLSLYNALKALFPESDPPQKKYSFRSWFSDFAKLRNATRGHGAPTLDAVSKICNELELSINFICDNLGLFRRPMAYLYRNLSGKYNVVAISNDTECFNYLRASKEYSYTNGVYIHFGKHLLVELLESNVDLGDFYFPNGGFGKNYFENISYITGNKISKEVTKYLLPANELPTSETEGLKNLITINKCFTNLPPKPELYIKRESLEQELYDLLYDDRHPIITLHGRGGIGKTSLALAAIHKLTDLDRFFTIIWFSARDIDLTDNGAKQVKPSIICAEDISKEYCRLVEPEEIKIKGFKEKSYFERTMTNNPLGATLYIFDNFETVKNPNDLFTWIDTFIRLPNKVLITSRFRDFKGDYPIEVKGMNYDEYQKLVKLISRKLSIEHLISTEYLADLFSGTDGHPYAVKVFLGELASKGRVEKIKTIISRKEDILSALFERSYGALSPAARRIFLTLCSWRSTIPQLALESVLLRSENDSMDVSSAVEELSRFSFVDIRESPLDKMLFLNVPLSASEFGKKKLTASDMKSLIQEDVRLLLYFGPMQTQEIAFGIEPKISKLFRHIAYKISQGIGKIEDYIEILEYICTKYNKAWIFLSNLYEESNLIKKARESLISFLETTENPFELKTTWQRIADLSNRELNIDSELHALAELSNCAEIEINEISNIVNRINSLLSKNALNLKVNKTKIFLEKIANKMESLIEEGDATDYSRLSWLLIYMNKKPKAKKYVKKGYEKDPFDEHIIKLAQKIKIS